MGSFAQSFFTTEILQNFQYFIAYWLIWSVKKQYIRKLFLSSIWGEMCVRKKIFVLFFFVVYLVTLVSLIISVSSVSTFIWWSNIYSMTCFLFHIENGHFLKYI